MSAISENSWSSITPRKIRVELFEDSRHFPCIEEKENFIKIFADFILPPRIIA